jgi:galactofuranosylgalactofuranosylrhamnosyl-N-acetylglucosaminyl-diphospho-decaprenol beta-1,5/1,6-galactofuranosyltransferase
MFTLAHFFFKSSIAPGGLLWRMDAAPVGVDVDSITLRPGTTLDLDTYFNCFYESYWRFYTGLRQLAFTARLGTPARVTITRVSSFGDRSIVAALDGQAGDIRLDVPLPRFSDAEAGRLYVTITALEKNVMLEKAQWVTESTPQRETRFDLITPTAFNREDFLGPSIQRLLSYAPLRGVLSRTVLINQSASRLQDHPAFAFLKDAELAARTHIVDQSNYGSTGGFTRGVVEMFGSGDATHALFMDDDVQIEPECVYRAYAFARYANALYIVGGHMLDLMRPQMLYEAANTVRLERLTVQNPIVDQDIDAQETKTLDRFLKPLTSHYNAWWLCAIPRQAFERFGLSPPFFVRGDDVEIGLRARENGMQTISLPGMAVWHEPFYLKPGNFKEYYIIRNMLINAAVHGSGPGLMALPILWARFTIHLLRFDYALAALTLRGVMDYMKGPSLLSMDGAGIQQEIMALQKSWTTAKAMPMWIAPSASAGKRPSKAPASLAGLFLRLIYNMVAPARGAADADTKDHIFTPAVTLNDRWVLGNAMFANTLLLSNPYEPQTLLHQRDWVKFWALFSRMAGVSFNLLTQGASMRGKWRQAFREMTTLTFWKSYLKLGHKGAANDGDKKAA